MLHSASPFPPLGERFDRLEEQLTVVTGLWSTPTGEACEHEGPHYALRANPGLVSPVQPGGVPIIVGGAGQRRTPTLAARYAPDSNRPTCTKPSPAPPPDLPASPTS